MASKEQYKTVIILMTLEVMCLSKGEEERVRIFDRRMIRELKEIGNEVHRSSNKKVLKSYKERIL